MCKTHRTQKFRAQRLSRYSFGGIWRPIQPSHLKNREFQFFTKFPTKPSSYAMVHRQPWPFAKTHRTQNFRAPRLSRYSFGDIWRPFQPSLLKKHEFHFFTKLPTKPSSYVVVHRPTWPCAKPTELKSFMHKDFHGIHSGTFVGLFNPHISKITNFNFSQNSPPCYLAMPWCTANLGHVQKPTELKTFVHQDFHGIHLGHLETFPTLTSKKPRISIFQ